MLFVRFSRTIELIEEPLSRGRTFFFRVNGVDIFAKGSNWIPAHVLPGFFYQTKLIFPLQGLVSITEKVTDEYIYDLLYSAKEAHMNMLRVWGGNFLCPFAYWSNSLEHDCQKT